MYVLPIKKTAVMVFNKAGRLLKESKNFFDGKIKIPSVREYYYFEIVFSLNGSLSNAQQKLRSYFSLEICFKKQLYSSYLANSYKLWVPNLTFGNVVYSKPHLK